MARDEKRVELRPVDDAPAEEIPVIRLEKTGDVTERSKSLRTRLKPAEDSHRLEVPAREEFEGRTHQPGLEALVEQEVADPQFLEKDWGSQSEEYRIPWGWFVLIGLAIGLAVLWSLSAPETSGAKTEDLRATSTRVVLKDAAEDREASELIDRIQATLERYFAASSVDEMLKEIRQPTRVEPLMRSYYETHPLTPTQVTQVKVLQPLTVEKRADFWMATVELSDQSLRNLILEVSDPERPQVDWETLVNYQPMPWDAFATSRPAGTSLDFRVYVEADTFYSHEFADSNQWICYRLTAAESEETLFGYAKVGGPVAEEIQTLLRAAPSPRATMILRLTVPVGIASRRGVVIEAVTCPRWMHVTPPEK